MGVWIETLFLMAHITLMVVTPRVGVWIETVIWLEKSLSLESLPVWECGLKQDGR